MLRLSLRSVETFDEEKGEFIYLGGVTVDMEHSLYTVSKWEEVHKKAFIKAKMDFNFVMSYLESMCLTPDIPSTYWVCITHDQLKEVLDYIGDPHSALAIQKDNSRRGRNKTITCELIYYWMISLNIPIEFEHWHFNKLMTLIDVCATESAPKDKKGRKKPPSKSTLQRQRELNAKQRALFNTKG